MKKALRRKHTKAQNRKSHPALQEDSQREAILDERHDLQKLFPAPYNPQISIFTPERVEVILTLCRAQAENLARLLKQSEL